MPSGDFGAFFKAVHEAARKHGIQVHVVCGATRGDKGRLAIASHGVNTLGSKDPALLEYCYETMSDSLSDALAQLTSLAVGVPQQPVAPVSNEAAPVETSLLPDDDKPTVH